MIRQTLTSEEFLSIPLGSGNEKWQDDSGLCYTALFASTFRENIEKTLPEEISEDTIRSFFSPGKWKTTIDSIWFNNYELYGDEEKAVELISEFKSRLKRAEAFVLADFRTAVPARKDYAFAVSPRRRENLHAGECRSPRRNSAENDILHHGLQSSAVFAAPEKL